jgi:hypothetical protein
MAIKRAPSTPDVRRTHPSRGPLAQLVIGSGKSERAEHVNSINSLNEIIWEVAADRESRAANLDFESFGHGKNS